MTRNPEPSERSFERVFAHYGMVLAFLRRRGSHDPEALAADTMSIAWRRLSEIDPDRCLPWLLTTARNLLANEYRARRPDPIDPVALESPDPGSFDFVVDSLDPNIDAALQSLDSLDREALTLIAWEELTPREAAESLGIKATAFRVRLHRARRRFKESLAGLDGSSSIHLSTREESP